MRSRDILQNTSAQQTNMIIKYHSLIWAFIILILGLITIYTVRVYLRDQNRIYAAAERAHCQIGMIQANQTEFNICQDIFNSTSHEKSIF